MQAVVMKAVSASHGMSCARRRGAVSGRCGGVNGAAGTQRIRSSPRQKLLTTTPGGARLPPALMASATSGTNWSAIIGIQRSHISLTSLLRQDGGCAAPPHERGRRSRGSQR